MLEIRSITRSPTPNSYNIRLYVLIFSLDVDVFRLVTLYEENDHVEAAFPNEIPHLANGDGSSVIGEMGWGEQKRKFHALRQGEIR